MVLAWGGDPTRRALESRDKLELVVMAALTILRAASLLGGAAALLVAVAAESGMAGRWALALAGVYVLSTFVFCAAAKATRRRIHE